MVVHKDILFCDLTCAWGAYVEFAIALAIRHQRDDVGRRQQFTLTLMLHAWCRQRTFLMEMENSDRDRPVRRTRAKNNAGVGTDISESVAVSGTGGEYVSLFTLWMIAKLMLNCQQSPKKKNFH